MSLGGDVLQEVPKQQRLLSVQTCVLAECEQVAEEASHGSVQMQNERGVSRGWCLARMFDFQVV
jgi:hypothetical protein